MFNLRKYLFVLAIGCSFIIYSSPVLANNFEKGKSAYLTNNWKLALNELSPLAKQGHAESQLLIANMYSNGNDNDIKQNATKAKVFYELSAKNGNSYAMLALATIYSAGVEIPENPKKGIYWFTKSAEWGNHISQFTLASMFTEGYAKADISVDKLAGYKWFRIASSIDDVPRITKASKGLVEVIIKELTPAQIEKVEKEIKFWRPKTGEPEAYKP